ncbi:MAG: hypothetical protein JJD98_01220 [Polaromonas sp.]|nr:hypothetical protein [Polaromonas sp.]
MAQYVEVNGQTIEFPDGMALGDMESAIKANIMSIKPVKPTSARAGFATPPVAAGPWNDYPSQPATVKPWDEYAAINAQKAARPPIDARMVVWDKPASLPTIDPRMVKWQDVPANSPDATPAAPMSRAEKLMRGMKDPLDAAAQLFEHAMPDSFNRANHAVNNWIADKTGMLAKLPDNGIDGLIRQQEAAYQAQRAAAGESGFDGYRFAGNVASPMNLVAMSKVPAAATALGRIGAGVLAGGVGGALSPVNDGGNFWNEKGKQVGIGAATGGVLSGAAGGVSRLISPNASKNANLQLLKKEGVQPTIGQTLGGWANSLEEKAQSLPIVGDAITAARQRANDQLNKAAFNRALSPIGETLPKNIPLGGSAVEYTSSRLGAAYDQLLPKLTTQADDQFATGLNNLRSSVQSGALDPKYSTLFDKTLQTRVLDKFQGQNSMTGQTLKDTESFLGNEIKRFGMSQDPDARLLGDAYKEVQSQLRSLVTRSNPQYADELSAINTGWANFKRVQNAAAKVGADDGVFTPSQLQSAVRVMDKSKDKARFAEGNALMQDLSGAAKSQMGGKIADSGTAGRLMMGAGALGSGLLHPAIPVGLLGGAAAYTPPVQSLLRGLVSSRPDSAQAIAEALRQASPFLIPGGAQVGLGLLNQ